MGGSCRAPNYSYGRSAMTARRIFEAQRDDEYLVPHRLSAYDYPHRLEGSRNTAVWKCEMDCADQVDPSSEWYALSMSQCNRECNGPAGHFRPSDMSGRSMEALWDY